MYAQYQNNNLNSNVRTSAKQVAFAASPSIISVSGPKNQTRLSDTFVSMNSLNLEEDEIRDSIIPEHKKFKSPKHMSSLFRGCGENEDSDKDEADITEYSIDYQSVV